MYVEHLVSYMLGTTTSLEMTMEYEMDYETQLEPSDSVSSTASSVVDIPLADYLKEQSGETNPIRRMLNNEDSQSEEKINWKDFFPSATLSDSEYYQRQYMEVKHVEDHKKSTSVRDMEDELISMNSEDCKTSDTSTRFCEISSFDAFYFSVKSPKHKPKIITLILKST